MIRIELEKYPQPPEINRDFQNKYPFDSMCKSWTHNRELGPCCVQIVSKMHCDKDVIRRRGRISLKRERRVLSMSPINSITHQTWLTHRLVSFLTVTVY